MSITQAVQAMLGGNQITGFMYSVGGARYYYDAAGREYYVEVGGEIKIWVAQMDCRKFPLTETSLDELDDALEAAMSETYKRQYP